MNRRDSLLSLAALAAAPLARAEVERIRRIGVLIPAKQIEPLLKPFREQLASLGWVEGRNLALEVRNVDNQYDRAPALAGELVHLKCEVIVAGSTAVALAAKQAAGTTPVVFAWVSDPIGSGLVKQFARPGGNVTGITNLVFELAPKQLELLKALDPRLKRVAVLADARLSVPFIEAAKRGAPSLGLQLLQLDAGNAEQIDVAFESAGRERVPAMILPPHPLYAEHRVRIAQLALRHRIATAFQFRSFVTAGGLLSYGPDMNAIFLRTTVYVDKILRGAKPGDLPVEQADRFETVINRKTAAALGLAIPPSLLARADEVIE